MTELQKQVRQIRDKLSMLHPSEVSHEEKRDLDLLLRTLKTFFSIRGEP